MGKLWEILALFRKGNAVADPALWKNGGITAALLIPVIMALARVAEAFGVPLPISEIDAATLAAAVLYVLHIVLTVITSPTVGLPAQRPPISPPKPAGFGDGTT